MNITKEDIRKIEQAHYLMQLSGYFTELYQEDEVKFAYTDKLIDTWYNQAYDVQCENTNIDSLINKVENYFLQRDRLPCFYLSPTTKPKTLNEVLVEKGYEKFEEEAWMFYDLSNKNNNEANNQIIVKQVETKEDISIFSEIYRKGLPGPEVEKYIDSAIHILKNPPQKVSVQYLICFFGDEPAGILCLHQLTKYVGVYAIATLPAFQKKGIARSLITHAADIAKARDASYMFFQTDTGEAGERIFEKVGFRTLFIREGYTKKDKIPKLEHR